MVSQKSKYVNSITYIYIYLFVLALVGVVLSPTPNHWIGRVLYCAGPLVGSIDSRETHHWETIFRVKHTQTHTLEYANTYAYTQARASITHWATTATAPRFALYLLNLLGT